MTPGGNKAVRYEGTIGKRHGRTHVVTVCCDGQYRSHDAGGILLGIGSGSDDVVKELSPC